MFSDSNSSPSSSFRAGRLLPLASLHSSSPEILGVFVVAQLVFLQFVVVFSSSLMLGKSSKSSIGVD